MQEKNKELEELKQKCEEYLNGWKRERADFLNYKKEEASRIGELCQYSSQKLILKILPILDNIELAETHLKDLPAQAGEGFLLIKKQFIDVLQKEGIEAIKTIGEKFNPNLMEAVEEAEQSGGMSDIPPATVLVEIQKGYTLCGKVIRPAKVKITK